MCGRPQGNVPGFVFFGPCQGDPQFGMYRRADDPHLNSRQDNEANGIDWKSKAETFAKALTPCFRGQLAKALALPEAALSALAIGYMPAGPHRQEDGQPIGPCWTFPEVTGHGRIVGISCRYPGGQKKAMARGKRGLTVPVGYRDREGPLFLPEGPSDALALTALGLSAVGRPSNMGGVEDLAILLQDFPKDRGIIVVGEFDPKPDGKWPGKEGAVKVAAELENKLGRPVSWCLPPDGAKDVRAWVLALNLPHDTLDAWHEAGLLLTGLLKAQGCPADKTPTGLATTCLAEIRPQPVRYLVPGYLPLGKLVLLAGDGGHGKSTLTLSLAACLTTGRPCMRLDYPPCEACDVLLVGCEDDFADTVVPRLLAAGADLSRVFRVDGIKTKDGKPATFSLAHYDRIEEELRARPGVRLVGIDPAGAYIGKSGVDDYNDSELRSLLGPLAELAARARVTFILIKHLVKGATAKAVNKVGGSVGYVNSVRAAFVVAADPEEDGRKFFLPLKFNLGPKPGGLAYRMDPLEPEAQQAIVKGYASHLDTEDQTHLAGQLFRVSWQGGVQVDADTVLSENAKKDRSSGKVNQCAAWLLEFLADFCFPSEEVFAAAEAKGFTRDNCYRAKAKLDDQVRAANRDFRGVWHWGRGDPKSWTVRPAYEAPNSPEAPNNQKFHKSPNSEGPKFGEFGNLRVFGGIGDDAPNTGTDGQGEWVDPLPP
jgi:hypothetical protein